MYKLKQKDPYYNKNDFDNEGGRPHLLRAFIRYQGLYVAATKDYSADIPRRFTGVSKRFAFLALSTYFLSKRIEGQYVSDPFANSEKKASKGSRTTNNLD